MRIITLLTLLLSLLAAPAPAFELSVVHLNDTHSHLSATPDKLRIDEEKTYVKLGGWTRLTSGINAIRASRKNVALLHAGDAVQGGLYFMRYNGKPEMDFMNRLQFDAMVLGNHEFDKGARFLADLLTLTRFPVLSANLDATDAPLVDAQIQPYTILTYGKERVGIIGLTTKDTAFTSSPGKSLRFRDEFQTARKYVAELTRQGVNKIILLTHVGLEVDKELAAKIPGIDLIVGGHSHTLLGDENTLATLGKTPEGPYPVRVTGPNQNKVYIVTAWKWGRILPLLDLTFDEAGRITRITGRAPLVLADSLRQKNADKKKVEVQGAERAKLLSAIARNRSAEILPANQNATDFLKPYAKGLDALRAQIIGQIRTPLPHVREPDAAHPAGSLLAPLVCDSMRWRMAHTGTPADVALLNAGSVRTSLAKGPFSVGDAYTLMPFANTLYLLKLSGAQLVQALEYGVDRGDGAFPYVAGARYTADMTRPKGKRIVSVQLQAKDGQWQPLDPDKTCTLVINSYLAKGGDGYDMFQSLLTPDSDTGFVDSQTFIDYVQAKKDLFAPKSTGVTLRR